MGRGGSGEGGVKRDLKSGGTGKKEGRMKNNLFLWAGAVAVSALPRPRRYSFTPPPITVFDDPSIFDLDIYQHTPQKENTCAQIMNKNNKINNNAKLTSG